LGVRDPGSNPGIPIHNQMLKCHPNQRKQEQQDVSEHVTGKKLKRN
jgi:hypothetical protein